MTAITNYGIILNGIIWIRCIGKNMLIIMISKKGHAVLVVLGRKQHSYSSKLQTVNVANKEPISKENFPVFDYKFKSEETLRVKPPISVSGSLHGPQGLLYVPQGHSFININRYSLTTTYQILCEYTR